MHDIKCQYGRSTCVDHSSKDYNKVQSLKSAISQLFDAFVFISGDYHCLGWNALIDMRCTSTQLQGNNENFCGGYEETFPLPNLR